MAGPFALFAVRGLDADALADRFPEHPPSAFASAGAWGWLRLDPEDSELDRETLRARIAGQGELAIDVREDGEGRWLAALSPRKGRPLCLGVDPALYAAMTDRGALKGVRSASDLVERHEAEWPDAYRTPAECLAKGAGKPAAKGLAAVLKARARFIAEFLDATGVEYVEDDLIRVLAGGPGGDDQETATPGRLADFLAALGLEEAVTGLPPGRACADEAGDIRALAPAAVPIAGGPVPLAAGDAGRLWRLAWFCDTDAEADLILTPPPGRRVELPRLDDFVTIRKQGGTTHVDMAWNPPGPRDRAFARLGEAVVACPEGTRVVLVAGNATPPDPDEGVEPLSSGNQRYEGVVSGGTWWVERAYPPIDAEDLRAALEVAATVDAKGPIAVASEAEARAIVELARKSAWFGDEARLPRVKGATLVSRDDRLPLAMMIFRRRFAAGPWDVESGRRRDEASNLGWDEMIEDVGRKVGEALAAPASDEVLLQTERAVFRRADLRAMKAGIGDMIGALFGAFDDLDEPPPQTPAEKLEPVERGLLALDFTPLGDVHCDRLGELILRGYAGPDGATYAAVAAGTFGQFVYEFVTGFTNGATLTTSVTPGLKDQRRRKIFKRSHPDATVEDLHVRHHEGIAELAGPKAGPAPVEPTLEGFCRALDDYIRREL